MTPQAGTLVASFNVLYPHHEGARFDLAYYRETHIPLVKAIMKPAAVTLIEGVATPDGPAPFAMIAHIQFASMEALQAASASRRRTELRDDLTNFTDITPTIMIGRTG